MRDTGAQMIPLADGRKLSFAEYGDRTGHPMIYCHGWPSSRFEALLVDDAAAAVRVRLIAIDRPGTGWSDYLPGRRLVDWPDHLHFLDRLPEMLTAMRPRADSTDHSR